MASKAEKEYNEKRKELDLCVARERDGYTERLKKLVKNLVKANVVHCGLYFLSQYNGMLPFADLKSIKNKEEIRVPIFNCCTAGLRVVDPTNNSERVLEFDIPQKLGANGQIKIDDQLNLDKLKQFRIDHQWFVHVFTEQNYHYYESRTLDLDSEISIVVAWKLEEKIIFVCYGNQLDQTQLEISTQVVSSYVQAVFTSDQNDSEQYKEAQKLNNLFVVQKSPLYDDLYLPSDQETEVKQEKVVVQVKENFEVLTSERFNCKKLPPNQQQFVQYIADTLKTYPNIIENLGQFKVSKEEFDEHIKNDFFDDYLEFWFVDFMNITTEKDPEDDTGKKQYITDISLTYQQEHRDKWLESQKVLLQSARAILEACTKKSDKTELSLIFELVKYFMERVTLYKNNNEVLGKYQRKDPNYFRKLRQRQENENKLLFQLEKQPDKWEGDKKEKPQHKKEAQKLQCQPRDILAPFVDNTATSESLAKAVKLILDLAGIQSVIVFGETMDKVGEFWNKICINTDWANLDVFRCCYLNDFRYFNIDDECLAETHVGIAGEEEKYPKCTTLKLSYFSMARTLISETNLDQAVELIANQAVIGIKNKQYSTEQFCFTCSAEDRQKLFANFQAVDDAVSREVGANMRCDSWELVQGDEKGKFLVVRFYFEPL